VVRIVPNSVRGPAKRNKPGTHSETPQCGSKEAYRNQYFGCNLGLIAFLQPESDVNRKSIAANCSECAFDKYKCSGTVAKASIAPIAAAGRARKFAMGCDPLPKSVLAAL
jgi:hypothetical protein